MVISEASFAASSGRPPFVELFDGVLALLDHGGEDLQLFLLVQVGALVDAFHLQCCLHHSQGGEAQLFLATHGVNHLFLNTFGQAHGLHYRG